MALEDYVQIFLLGIIFTISLMVLIIAIFIGDPLGIILPLIEIFLLIILILYHYYLQVREKNPPSKIARALAVYHLNQFRGISKFENLIVSNSFPMSDMSGKECYYDVKLKSALGQDNGFMLINTDQSDFPVLFFCLEGPSLREQFKSKIGHEEFKITLLTPTYAFATDDNNNILTILGDYNPDISITDQLDLDDFNFHKFHQLIWEKVQIRRREFQASIKSAWRNLPSGGKTTSQLTRPDVPSGNWFEYYVEGHEWTAELSQIPANQGVNNNNFTSGCGPTAWGMFIAWHDLVWVPEFLHGSQDRNGQNYGSGFSPNQELAWNTYIDRKVMEFVNVLNTYNGNGVGWTYASDMENGFNHVRNTLGYNFTAQSHSSNHNSSVQKVHDCIIGAQNNNYKSRPLIVMTPSHFCVAAGFIFNWDDQTSFDSHWIYINTGWGYKAYISSAYIEEYWYFRDIILPTGAKTIYQETSPHSPVLITTYDPTRMNQPNEDLLDMLWIFWLGDDDKIYYVSSTQGQGPNMANKGNLNVESIYPPTITTDGYNIYLAYVDSSDFIHLMQYDYKQRTWGDLDFIDLKTTVKPAIMWLNGWLSIAFNDVDNGDLQVLGTAKDLNRPNAWPPSFPTINESERYWTQSDALGTESGVDMIALDDRSIFYRERGLLCWINRTTSGSSLSFRLAKADGSDYEYFRNDLRGFHGLNVPSLTIYNYTMYAAYIATSGGRIRIDRIRPFHLHAGLDFEQVAYLNDEAAENPSISFVERNNRDDPRLAICWIDSANKINIRFLSVDDDYFPIDYSNY